MCPCRVQDSVISGLCAWIPLALSSITLRSADDCVLGRRLHGLDKAFEFV